MTLDNLERHQVRELLDQEIQRTLDKMKTRGRHKPVVVDGEAIPSYRIHELRWQKIEFLTGIMAKLK